MIYFEYRGKMVSGKNQIKTLWVHGRMLKVPNSNFKRWRREFQSQIFAQRFGKKMPLPFAGPVRLVANYYPGDLLRRDLTGVLDAFQHAVEIKNGGVLVHDDAQFKDVHITEMALDRGNPRFVFQVEAI